MAAHLVSTSWLMLLVLVVSLSVAPSARAKELPSVDGPLHPFAFNDPVVPIGEHVVNGGFSTGDLTGWVGNGSFLGVSGGAVYMGSTSTEGGIYQLLTGLIPNAQYVFSFDMYSYGDSPSSFHAYFDHQMVVGQYDPPDLEPQHLSFVVRPSGATALVEIYAQDDIYFLFLDNVSVIAPAPTPNDYRTHPLFSQVQTNGAVCG
jgi:hypothetical protein